MTSGKVGMNQVTDDWITRLESEGEVQDQALQQLGELLRRRLHHAFQGKAKVDDSLIDDVVQDSLSTILKSMHQFEGKSQFTTWATTLSVRTAIREMRRLRWKDTSLEQLAASNPGVVESPSSKDDPETKASSDQMVATMYRIIEEDLTEKQREVLLAYLRGMPQAEIGRRIGSNRNAVYQLGFDARQKLREGMEAAGYSAADLASFEATR